MNKTRRQFRAAVRSSLKARMPPVPRAERNRRAEEGAPMKCTFPRDRPRRHESDEGEGALIGAGLQAKTMRRMTFLKLDLGFS